MNASGPRERSTFTLSSAIRHRLEEYVPEGERSRFVEKAIDEALTAAARNRARTTVGGIRGLSTGGEDGVDVLRRLRRQTDGRSINLPKG